MRPPEGAQAPAERRQATNDDEQRRAHNPFGSYVRYTPHLLRYGLFNPSHLDQRQERPRLAGARGALPQRHRASERRRHRTPLRVVEPLLRG
jgi:hypothetical protein